MTSLETFLLIYALCGVIGFLTGIEDGLDFASMVALSLFWPIWFVRFLYRGFVCLWRNG